MLEPFHLQGIDEIGLTPEQWRVVQGFCCHNFGNVVGAATLMLSCCRDGLMTPAEIEAKTGTIRAHYCQIVDAIEELASDSKVEKIISTTGDTGNAGKG